MRDVVQTDRSRRHFLQPKNFSRGALSERFRSIEPLVTGRSVLDLGSGTGHDRQDWMYAQIARVAAEVVGVEIDAATVEAVRARGYEIEHADAEALDLGRTFDVVFAGELIEHLGNFDGFLGSVRRHLTQDGVLILTTPNAFAVSNVIYRLLPGGRVRVNRDHTCWFCEDTMRHLLDRFGFEAEVTFLRHETPGRGRSALAALVRAPLPERMKWNTLLVVARPRPCYGDPAGLLAEG